MHHHCRLRLERRRCDARRRVGHRRVYACGEREVKEEGEKSGWMRFRKGGDAGGGWEVGALVDCAGGEEEGRWWERRGEGWVGVGLRRVERWGLEVGMVDWLGSLAEGVVCMWDWV